ncbi:MAG: hypothetical protein HN564_02105, partial [Flavobacteriales bacterium]|nr:hypothetical protein [Flavobacteriales bacterium]
NGFQHSQFSTASFWQASAALPLIIKSGDDLSYNSGSGPSEVTLYGYLVDENYFADCGGGGNNNSGGGSSSNGISSTEDVNDFDQNLHLFDTEIYVNLDNGYTYMKQDTNNNIFVVGAYSSPLDSSIGGISLNNAGILRSMFIVKYDSLDNIDFVISEDVISLGFGFDISGIDVDNNNNIFVVGHLESISPKRMFIRKYNGSTGQLISSATNANINSNTGSSRALNVVADNNGGAYVVGYYAGTIDFGGNTSMLPSNTYLSSVSQGFIVHFDNSLTATWSDFSTNYTTPTTNCDGNAMQSVILHQNNDIYVSGIKNVYSNDYKYFMRRYSNSGTLLSDSVSSTFNAGGYNIGFIERGSILNSDNNGDIYFFANAPSDFTLNSYLLPVLNARSDILFQFNSSLNTIDAYNFGQAVGPPQIRNLEVLSNNNIILNARGNDILFNNIFYTTLYDNSMQYIAEINTSNEIQSFYGLYYLFGYTEYIGVSSNNNNNNNNNFSVLYDRESGIFINNGITYPAGNYIVRY